MKPSCDPQWKGIALGINPPGPFKSGPPRFGRAIDHPRQGAHQHRGKRRPQSLAPVRLNEEGMMQDGVSHDWPPGWPSRVRSQATHACLLTAPAKTATVGKINLD
jgi:hypothetical protein